MKNFGIKFIISVSLTIAGTILLFLGYHLIAAFLFIAGFFPNGGEITQYASFFQFLNFRINTLLLGYTVDVLTGNKFYFNTIGMFLLSFAGLFRLELYKTFSVKNGVWLEIIGLVGAYGFYLYAALQHPLDWKGWALPLPPMLLMTFIGSSIIYDGFTKYEPKAEADNTELGQKAPAFSLNNTEGKNVSLTDFENKNHVLLIFVRGDWCPSCHIMIRAYERETERLKEKNIIPIGISPDSNEVNQAMMERLGWKTMLLTDDKQQVAARYGLLFRDNGARTNYDQGMVLPASFLIDKFGIIRYMSRSDRAGEFLSPSLIFPIIDKLS